MNRNDAIRLTPDPKPPERDDRIEQAIDIAMMLPEGHQARAQLLAAAAQAWMACMQPISISAHLRRLYPESSKVDQPAESA